MKSSTRLWRLTWRAALPLALSLAACVQAGGGGTAGVGGSNGSAGQEGGTGGTTGGGTGGTTTGSGGRVGGPGTGGTVVTGGGGRTGQGGTGVGGTGVGGRIANGDAGIRPDLTGRKALFIVDDAGSIDEGDALITSLLDLRGVTVTYGDMNTPPAMAAGFNLLIISGGAGADLGLLFKDVPIPVVIFGNSTYQNMGFVPNSSSRGSVSGANITITDTSTLLSSDLAMGATVGVINPLLGNTQYTWGIPGGTAIKVAAVVGMPTQMAVFAYEKGATMAVGTAAARRVALGWKSNAVKLLTTEAFKLQDGAFSWTAGAP